MSHGHISSCICFLSGQLERALPSSILDKYEDRLKEENLNLADIGDLVR